MKTRRILFALFAVALLAGGSYLKAQTYQALVTASFENSMAWCLNRPTSGSWTYHVNYHIGPDGYMDWIHWNLHDVDIRDTETGQRYRIVDTGHDKYGVMWDFLDFWETNNGFEMEGMDDDWLPLPPVRPVEGIFVNQAFKFMGQKGETYIWSILFHVNRNAAGEVTVEVYKEKMICN